MKNAALFVKKYLDEYTARIQKEYERAEQDKNYHKACELMKQKCDIRTFGLELATTMLEMEDNDVNIPNSR